MRALNPQVRPLSALLGDQRAEYCVLHGWESPPEDPASDLDVAVSPSDLTVFEEALARGGAGRPIQLLQHEASCYYIVLARRALGAERFAAVDLAVDYRRDGWIHFRTQELLGDRIRVNGFWAAAPETQFAYLLVKKILKEGAAERRWTRLRVMRSALGEDARTIARRLLGVNMGDLVVHGLAQAESSSLNAHTPALRRTLRWRVLRHDVLNPLRYWIPEWRRRWRRWRHPTGLCIAVLGPDGAGKTTLIAHLREQLRPVFRSAAVFHHRPRVLAEPRDGPPVVAPHGKPPHAIWLSALKIVYYVGLYACAHLLRVRPRLVRSTLVLFDRYYDDLRADPRRYRYQGPSVLTRLARRLIPAPDLYLVLDVPEDTLLRRKQELPKHEVQRQRAAYRRLGTDLPAAVVLDGSAPAGDLARAAIAIVIDYLEERYRRRHAHWFTAHRVDALEWLAATLPASSDTPVPSAPGPGRGACLKQLGDPQAFGWFGTDDGRAYVIPLHSKRSAVSSLALYNAQSRKGRLAKTILAQAVGLGAGPRCLRPAALPVGALAHHLQDVLRRDHVNVAVSVGPPHHLNRKAVVLVLTGEGEPIGFAKVGSNQATADLVRREADTLVRLSAWGFQSFDVPAVLHSGAWNGGWICVQAAPCVRCGPVAPALTDEHLAIVAELAAFHTHWVCLTRSEYWNGLGEHAGRVVHAHYGRVLEQGMRNAERWLGDAALPFHFSHGDFAPWNMKRGPQRPLVFDWEYACHTAAPALDALHFVYQTSRRLGRRDPRHVHRAFLEDRSTRASVQRALAGLGTALSQNLLLFLYYLHALAQLAREAEASAGHPVAHPELRALASIVGTAGDWV